MSRPVQNGVFLYLAVDLHDTHGKCAYLQVAKHPSFTLEHKHTLQNSNCTFLGAPSRTRTDTGRILSPLPLPIGL